MQLPWFRIGGGGGIGSAAPAREHVDGLAGTTP